MNRGGTWIVGLGGVETQPLLYAVQTKEYQKFGDEKAAVNGTQSGQDSG